MRSKIALLIFTSILSFAALSQPCTPDVNFPGTQGILPLTLPDAYVNTSYEVVAQFKAPLDTQAVLSGQSITYKVDSMRILAVTGLPSGLTYQCHVPSCMVLGGAVGCMKISGTPPQMGYFPLKVAILTSGRAFLTPQFPIAYPVIDTVTRYAILVNQATGLYAVVDSKNPLFIYPNPAKQQVTITTDAFEDGSLSIYNATGQLMLQKQVGWNEKEAQLDLVGFSKGFYFAEYITPHVTRRAKFLVN